MTLIDADSNKKTNRFISLLLLLTVIVFGGATATAQSPTIDGEEQLMVKLINDYRASKGLSQLKISIALSRAADWMSADMAAKNYFSHTDSLGRSPFVRMTAYNYNYPGFRGENLAAGYGDAARTFTQWKNSAGHNANMLNSNYNVIGISRVYSASSIYKYYWTTDFGSFVDATFGASTTATTTTTVQGVSSANAANFSQTIAPESIASLFGNQISPITMGASSSPPPTSLGGVSVTVNNVPAQLLYLSPGQINYVVPGSVSPGAAALRVMLNGNVTGMGTANIDLLSPSIFTVTANGKGTPSAQTTTDGRNFLPVANADGSPRALTVGTASVPNFLILYGTGFRRRSSLSGVRVTIGGVNAQVTYAGANAGFTGLDQLNVRLPLELRGRGLVDVIISVDNRPANTVRINIGN